MVRTRFPRNALSIGVRHWLKVKVLLLSLAALPLVAQNISVGVRGGLPLTDAISSVRTANFSFTSERPRYAVGPTFEVRLPLGLGFHVDALYRRITVSGTNSSAGAAPGTNSFAFWQFPVMLKLRLGAGPYRPFVSAGPSFSKLTGVGNAASCVVSLGGSGCAGRVLKQSGTGVAFGTGLDLALPVVRIAPEIRYTRLGANLFEGAGAATLASQRNQLEILIGVTF